ncbi:hypothetical protein [Streptomyces sp. AM6-12]|uniref:hypothetical protein n=1 Tax=Streptomyces sp. AM6-12 TaxID=3345149 RepID=UPI0037AA0187
MPRRRPSALRAALPVRARRRHPSIDHLSGSCLAALRRLDHARYWPGATTEAFRHWQSLAHAPLRRLTTTLTAPGCGNLGCCDVPYYRDHLEEALHALPAKSARELRFLVASLDEKILTRAFLGTPTGPWWREPL